MRVYVDRRGICPWAMHACVALDSRRVYISFGFSFKCTVRGCRKSWPDSVIPRHMGFFFFRRVFVDHSEIFVNRCAPKTSQCKNINPRNKNWIENLFLFQCSFCSAVKNRQRYLFKLDTLRTQFFYILLFRYLPLIPVSNENQRNSETNIRWRATAFRMLRI